MNYLRNQFQISGYALTLLRFFVGSFLIVASLNKLSDPQWHMGTILATFLQEQLQNGEAIFPFYHSFLAAVIVPNAELISAVILFIELYSGLAILLGCFTNIGLIGAMFLSFNLLFSGLAYPAVFLIVAQAVLFGTNSGAVFGIDRVLSKKIHSRLLVAQRYGDRQQSSRRKNILIATAIGLFLFALFSTFYILPSTKRLLENPAFLLVILSVIASATCAILALRVDKRWNQPIHRDLIAMKGSPFPASVGIGQNQHNVAAQKGDGPSVTARMNQYAKVLVPHNIERPAVPTDVNAEKNERNDHRNATLKKPSTTEMVNQYAKVLVPHNVKRSAMPADVKVQKNERNIVQIWL